MGEFLLADGTISEVSSRKEHIRLYFLRLLSLYSVYLLSIVCCIIIFVLYCNASNFIGDFERVRKPEEGASMQRNLEWKMKRQITFMISASISSLSGGFHVLHLGLLFLLGGSKERRLARQGLVGSFVATSSLYFDGSLPSGEGR